MSCDPPRLTIAALRGGGGKTTLTLALLSALTRAGRCVVPFKKGPDYIDAGWLAKAAGRPCYNLDLWLMTRTQVLASFGARTSFGVEGAIIEGNRGLYDGTDEEGVNSTAELAKLLGSPVVLNVDCTKATRTLAAVALGCRSFDPELALAGVVLNRVATSRQESLVRRTMERYAGLPVLGAIPRLKAQDLPERHLGLLPHQEHPAVEKVVRTLGEIANNYLDVDSLWKIARLAGPLACPAEPNKTRPGARRARIGVIQDSAFQFYYPENLELLESLGAELVGFSALGDCRLPAVDGLYLGGGFPETHAEALAANRTLREDLRLAARGGLPIYAECGGLMYLGRSLILRGATFPMAGVFPVDFVVEPKPQGHGYTQLRAQGENPYYPQGAAFTGHEFHYSRPLGYERHEIELVLRVERGYGFERGWDGLCRNNVLGLYTHVHGLAQTGWAESLVRLATVRARLDGKEGPL